MYVASGFCVVRAVMALLVAGLRVVSGLASACGGRRLSARALQAGGVGERRGVALSVGLEPVGAPSAVGHERHAHLEGPLHLFHHYPLHELLLLGHHAEVEFVVHLEYHL